MAGWLDITVQQYGAKLSKTKGRLRVSVNDRHHEIPLREIRSLQLASKGVRISSDVLFALVKEKIPLVLLDASARPLGCLIPVVYNTEVILAQVNARQSFETRLKLAAAFVRGKIRNQIHHLKILVQRETAVPIVEKAKEVIEQLDSIASELSMTRNKILVQEPFPGAILVREARASKLYWQTVKHFIPSCYGFHKRVKKGAHDSVNVFLNYGYGILFSVVYTAIYSEGLVPGLGFLHQNYKNRPALVFDLMEEFRPLVIDRLVVGLASEGRLPKKASGEKLSLLERKSFLLACEARLSKKVPYRGRVFMLKEIVVAQAKALKRALLTGKRYEPYICTA